MINSFKGDYAFLSNFYPVEIKGEDGIIYPSVEHYFQAQKTLDIEKRKQIAKASTPSNAKKIGRKVSLREDWESIKELIMLEGLEEKFSSFDLKEKLLHTGDEYLEEGNTWHDTYWGVCYCDKCHVFGANKLGKLLMQIREEKRKEKC
jgi:ribA/ribD-fused uncharacterized protein